MATKKTGVTSIEQLKEYSLGQLVKLPPFADGQEFYAMLRRPSLMAMARDGRIPNGLLSKANELFMSGGEGAITELETENYLAEMLEVFEVMARATFVEPTYDELLENGIELTDDQLSFIFTYSQMGVKALESFRY